MSSRIAVSCSRCASDISLRRSWSPAATTVLRPRIALQQTSATLTGNAWNDSLQLSQSLLGSLSHLLFSPTCYYESTGAGGHAYLLPFICTPALLYFPMRMMLGSTPTFSRADLRNVPAQHSSIYNLPLEAASQQRMQWIHICKCNICVQHRRRSKEQLPRQPASAAKQIKGLHLRLRVRAN